MLIDVIKRAQQLRGEIPHLVQPSQADYDRVCMLTEVETLRAEVSALRTRAETAERERDEAYAKGQRDKQEEAATLVEAMNIDTTKVSWRKEAAGRIRYLPIKERP
jgi:hypothetical protein